MKLFTNLAVAGVAVSAFSFIAPVVHAASDKVVIGDIDDMSGLYADVIGPGGVEAAKMAIDDFGGTVLGNKIEFMVTDHQNKPDIGSQKFRDESASRPQRMLDNRIFRKLISPARSASPTLAWPRRRSRQA